MKKSTAFYQLVLDSITSHIVVIGKSGEIQYANRSWIGFGNSNSCEIVENWIGVNYLDECDKAAAMGNEYGKNAGNGIKSVIDGRESLFYFEYPCHSPHEKRWFVMRVTPFRMADSSYFVISHQNITERKLAEEKVSNLARLDSLTAIPNRRTFSEFLSYEWRRCIRLNKSICLAIIDLDHFKSLNDAYGHQAGDECLVKVARVLKKFARRPSDICARYGGDEFVLAWGDVLLKEAIPFANQIRDEIVELNIPNCEPPNENYATSSIGLAEAFPIVGGKEEDLISKADGLLYRAKKSGRNRVAY